MEPTQCSETSAFNTQTPGKYPEDNLSLVNDCLYTTIEKVLRLALKGAWFESHPSPFLFTLAYVSRGCAQFPPEE
jgi:hypothetical protein